MSTNGIDFVIGGKDHAKPAMASVEQSLQRLEKKTDSLSASTMSLTKLTVGVAGAYALFKGAIASLSGLSGSIDDFDAAQESVRALDQAMEINGGSSEALMQQYEGLADTLEKTTNVAAETTQGLMQQAAIMGVSNEQLDDMAVAAIGLSEALSVSLDTGLEKVRLATEGNFKAFEKLIPSMKTMKTDEEKLAAVMELSARGLAMKEEASKSAAGSAEQMEHRVGNLLETIGGMLSPIRQLVNQGITVLADSLSGLLAPAAEYMQEVFADMGGWMDWVKEKVIAGVNLMVGAFTFFEVILTNLDSIWTIVVSQAELYMLQLGGTIMHVLTEVIPAYASWFRENFVNLMRDAVMLAYTVVSNHVQKIVDAFMALWEFIESGGTSNILGQLGEIAGRSYLEGFEASLTDLPTIASRTITDREQELAATIGQLGSNLGDEFARKMEERMIGIGDSVGDELNTNIDLSLANAGVTKRKDGTSGTSINATESRLLTRGPSSTMEKMLSGVEKIGQILTRTGEWVRATKDEITEMNRQDPKKVRFVAIK